MYSYVKDPALNITLNTQKKLADEKNIDFDFAIKDDISQWNIKSWDLNTLVGNLINNSFEAVINNEEKNMLGLNL
ncbi:hypothetical protein [Natranaerobius thermophilus]|uniref:hypothetical protein n=1 Tax=Natranaerobius thermophilus TaxID=375929 RepID=UPI0001663B8F|nr:hypothetical protein [Natranaerobius thermophilus]